VLVIAELTVPAPRARDATVVYWRLRTSSELAELAAPGAVLVGDSVTPAGSPQVHLRIRYRDLATPWWPQYNIPAAQMAALVEGTGWRMLRHLEDGDDHAVLLRRT